jgi:hypothetical protein
MARQPRKSATGKVFRELSVPETERRRGRGIRDSRQSNGTKLFKCEVWQVEKTQLTGQWLVTEVHGLPARKDRVAGQTLCGFKQRAGQDRILGVEFSAFLRVGREEFEALVEEVLVGRG